MADDNKKLSIGIETTADTKGAEQTSEALSKLAKQTEQANETGAESGKLTNQLSDKTKEYIKSLVGATEKAEKFHLTHRNIRAITRDLVKDMPELGEILSELSNPMMGLTFAIGAVVASMVEYQQEVTAMENRPGPDWEGNTKRIEEVRQSYEDATVAADKYLRELDTLEHRPPSNQDATARKINKLKELNTAETEALSQQQKMDEARINFEEEKGTVSHAEAIAQKLRLDEYYAQERIMLEQRVRAEEMNLKLQEFDKDTFDKGVAKQDLPAAQKSAADAHAAALRNDKKKETDQSNLDKALEERKKLQEDIAELQLKEQHTSSTEVGIWLAKKFGANIQSPEEARKMLEDRQSNNETSIALLQGSVHNATEAAPGLKEAADIADEKLDEIKDKLKSLTSRLNELSAMIPDEEFNNRLKNQTATHGAETDATTSAVKALPSLANSTVANHAELIDHVTKVLERHASNQQSLIATMERGNNIADSHTRAIKAIEQRVSRTEQATDHLSQSRGWNQP